MKLVFPGGEHPQVLLGQGVNRVGSAPDSSIHLDSPGVLPRHCDLHVTSQGVMLQVPSGTTVRVNDRDVDGLIALRPGDLVCFDKVQARLASLDAQVPRAHVAPPSATPANDQLAATTVRPVLPRYVLRGVSHAGFGRTFPLSSPTVIGRAPDCGIRLDHPGLSRHHARLTPTEEGLLVEDLGSTNGWLLNDQRTERAMVGHGDELGFDQLRFRVVAPGREAVQVAANRRSPRAVTAGVAGAPPATRWWWAGGAAAVVVVALVAGAMLLG